MEFSALKFESGDLLGDAKGIWQTLKSKEVPWIIRIIIAPVVALIYVGALGSFVWLDLIYGIAVALALPNLISSWVA